MRLLKRTLTLAFAILPFLAMTQSLTDGIYMPKQNFCGGVMLMQDQFTNYWEGTTKRSNLNIGTMTMQSATVMGIYGIMDHLNVIAAVPYIKTDASGGTLAGMSGIQDLTLGLKYKVIESGNWAANVVAGGSIPLTNYVAAYPLAIGNQSKTLFARGMIHFLNTQGWTAAVSGIYTLRSNITIDATNYYTDKNVFSNQVAMSDVLQWNARAGHYSYRWGAEAMLDRSAVLGGFDIRRNDMMFPSNRQESTRIGFLGFYRFKALNDLQVLGDVAYSLDGRNVGQALTLGVGFAMAFDWRKKEKK